MSIKHVHEEIERFLRSREPEVLCVTGKWGVGKTYGWMRFLQAAQTKGEVALTRYAYVSLFGQNSLDDLRYAIFENTVVTSEIAKGPDFHSLASSLKGIERIVRQGLFLGNLDPRGKGYLSGASRALFLAVRNQIVCIDDLERAGKALDVKDVLGMISYLKEQRGCKVALLFNQEALPAEAQKAFDDQLEKVVDTRVIFSPSATEAAAIAIDDRTTFKGWLANNCVALGITNLRVINKIERVCARLAELLKDFDEGVLKQGVHTATLFGWIHYQPREAPPWKVIEEFNPFSDFLREKKEEDEQGKAWRALIRSYGLTDVDEFDLVIRDGLIAGYFDLDRLNQTAAGLHARLEHGRRGNSFSEAWNLYHDSFVVGADEVLDRVSAAFRQSVSTITPLNLNGTVRLFKELGRAEEARQLLTYYMAHRNEGRAFYDLSRSPFGREVNDPDVMQAFADKVATFRDDRDPAQILINVIKNSGWNPEDVEKLATLTPDQFKTLFKENRGPDLRAMIRAALQFGTFSDATDSMKRVAANATEALRAIAGESEINARRVQAYGIVPSVKRDQ